MEHSAAVVELPHALERYIGSTDGIEALESILEQEDTSPLASDERGDMTDKKPQDDQTGFETASELRREPPPSPAPMSAPPASLPRSRKGLLLLALATSPVLLSLILYFVLR